MSEKKNQAVIVVKRINKRKHPHHGGQWKIAYSDFMTAMMAFFLLMWLLGSTTHGDLKGIADYFKTPLKVALRGGSGSGESSMIVPGGGEDLSRTRGQVRRGEETSNQDPISLKKAEAELVREETQRFLHLKERIEKLFDSNPLLRLHRKQLIIDMTPEGLRIQIVDEQNRPMFDLGSARLQPYTVEILRELGRVLNDVDNKVSLSGYTDAKPYSGGERGYSNWELSADRANASRRELIIGGMNEEKIIRVVGSASAILLDRENPLNPINRRISLLVMSKHAEELVRLESGARVTLPNPDGTLDIDSHLKEIR